MRQQLHILKMGLDIPGYLDFPQDTDLQFSPQPASETRHLTGARMQHDLGHITEFLLEIIKPNKKHLPARKKSGSYCPC